MSVVQRLLRVAVAFLIVFGSMVTILANMQPATAAGMSSNFQTIPCEHCLGCDHACVVQAACGSACGSLGLLETNAQASIIGVDRPTPGASSHVSSVGQQIPTPPPRLRALV
jgi:hypothetical protein